MAAQLCGHYDDKDQDYNRADHEGGDRPAFVVLGAQVHEGQDQADAPGIGNKDKDEAEQRADITAIPAAGGLKRCRVNAPRKSIVPNEVFHYYLRTKHETAEVADPFIGRLLIAIEPIGLLFGPVLEPSEKLGQPSRGQRGRLGFLDLG